MLAESQSNLKKWAFGSVLTDFPKQNVGRISQRKGRQRLIVSGTVDFAGCVRPDLGI